MGTPVAWQPQPLGVGGPAGGHGPGGPGGSWGYKGPASFRQQQAHAHAHAPLQARPMPPAAAQPPHQNTVLQAAPLLRPAPVVPRSPDTPALQQHHHHHHHHHHHRPVSAAPTPAPVAQPMQECKLCGICLSVVLGPWSSHLAMHHKEVMDTAKYWNAINAVQKSRVGIQRPPVDDTPLWTDVIQKIEAARMTREEIERKHAGVRLLGKLFLDIAEMTPFGSSVNGTGERGTSDTDVSARLLPSQHAAPNEEDVVRLVYKRLTSLLYHGPGYDMQLLTRTAVPLVILEFPSDTAMLDGALLFRSQQMLISFRSKVLRKLPPADFAHTEQPFAAWGKNAFALVFDKPMAAVEALLAGERIGWQFDSGGVVLAAPRCLQGRWHISARPHLGPRNSALIRTVLGSAANSEAATVACCVVKRWGKRHGVSDTRSAHLSSYALMLLFCWYLQRVGAAPHVDLQQVEPIRDIAMCPVPRKLTHPEVMHAQDLVVGFFKFYSAFDWGNAVTFNAPMGKAVPKEDVGITHAASVRTFGGPRPSHSHAWMAVIDPYDATNTARRVSFHKSMFITGAISATDLAISETDPERLKENLTHLFLQAPGSAMHPEQGAADSVLPDSVRKAVLDYQEGFHSMVFNCQPLFMLKHPSTIPHFAQIKSVV